MEKNKKMKTQNIPLTQSREPQITIATVFDILKQPPEGFTNQAVIVNDYILLDGEGRERKRTRLSLGLFYPYVLIKGSGEIKEGGVESMGLWIGDYHKSSDFNVLETALRELGARGIDDSKVTFIRPGTLEQILEDIARELGAKPQPRVYPEQLEITETFIRKKYREALQDGPSFEEDIKTLATKVSQEIGFWKRMLGFASYLAPDDFSKKAYLDTHPKFLGRLLGKPLVYTPKELSLGETK